MSDSTQHIIEIYLAKCDDTSEMLLTESDKQCLLKKTSERARKQFISSHSLLNRILLNKLHTDLSSLHFSLNTDGKPYLSPELFQNSHLYFSLSHCGDMNAVGISCGVELGIDLEYTSGRDLRACRKIAQRFFSPHEQEQLDISCHNAEDYRQLFFQIWTLKEAYLKALGTGIRTSLREISFNLSTDRIRLFTQKSRSINTHTFISQQIKGHSLAIAAANREEESIEVVFHSQ